MSRRIMWAVLAVVPLATAAGWTDPRSSALVELPVAGMQLLTPDHYREASALAARGGAALDVALKVVGAFEGSAQQIVQVNDGGEAPSRSRVTVVRDGILDDSVRGDRWEVSLERTAASLWRITEVKRAWRCRRGAQNGQFRDAAVPLTQHGTAVEDIARSRERRLPYAHDTDLRTAGVTGLSARTPTNLVPHAARPRA
jgi:hypothetical protein